MKRMVARDPFSVDWSDLDQVRRYLNELQAVSLSKSLVIFLRPGSRTYSIGFADKTDKQWVVK